MTAVSGRSGTGVARHLDANYRRDPTRDQMVAARARVRTALRMAVTLELLYHAAVPTGVKSLRDKMIADEISRRAEAERLRSGTQRARGNGEAL